VPVVSLVASSSVAFLPWCLSALLLGCLCWVRCLSPVARVATRGSRGFVSAARLLSLGGWRLCSPVRVLSLSGLPLRGVCSLGRLSLVFVLLVAVAALSWWLARVSVVVVAGGSCFSFVAPGLRLQGFFYGMVFGTAIYPLLGEDPQNRKVLPLNCVGADCWIDFPYLRSPLLLPKNNGTAFSRASFIIWLIRGLVIAPPVPRCARGHRFVYGTFAELSIFYW
jgi:hypothetical protein